ncbi:MAG: ThuA domain-containing protein [Reichenbachiella sp.]
MKQLSFLFITSLILALFGCQTSPSNTIQPSPKLKALIIDGENNHGIWPKTTMMMKDYLEQTGLFDVEIERTKYLWLGPHYDKKSTGLDDINQLLTMYPLVDDKEHSSLEEPKPDPDFSPDFDQYDVVVSNFGWKASSWSDLTKQKFEKYMKNGGGFVLIHAADNSWGDWTEYNRMIGVGGWGGRNTQSGPYVYYDNSGVLQRDTTDGKCGAHGPAHEYVVQSRAKDHPIMKGVPDKWLHTKDELYGLLRGPAENMTVLATAFSDMTPDNDKEGKSEGRNEPVMMAIEYGKGRVFHSIMGHMDYSFECVGFMTTFQRGSEWAASGKVTQVIPTDFPLESAISKREWK